MVRLSCIFLSLLVSIASTHDETARETIQGTKYTADWVVKITEGGKEMADEMATKYGFKNLGKLQVFLCITHYSH